jgi:trehalose/maltose hydrolase-like predicted phosphorylase
MFIESRDTHTTALCVPSEDAWLLVEEHFVPKQLPHFETLFTLANGYAGVRGSLEMSPHLGDPGFYVAGVYDQVADCAHEIVNLPCWLSVQANLDGFDLDLRKGEVLDYRRTLDMRQGLLFTTLVWRNDIKQRFRWESVRLLHQTEKHVSVLWGTLTSLDAAGTLTMGTTLDAWAVKHGSASGGTRYGEIQARKLDGAGIGLAVTTCGTGIQVAEASHLHIAGASGRQVHPDDDRISEAYRIALEANCPVAFELRTVTYTSREVADPVAAATAELQRVGAIEVAELVASHTHAWAQRWAAADIVIRGDARAQHALRVNLFHLLSLAHPADDHISLGAKGLHGNGYSGLIFWDTEIYLLPPFIYTEPAVARALLQYRYHMLPDAVENAREMERPGASYPWTSSLRGRQHPWPGWQEHVGSDIAYAVHQYLEATGDQAFFLQYGAELLIATALYWPARIEADPDKGYVVRRIMGPDEIHGNIDNNTYTNGLVQWHLRRAVQAVGELRAAGCWDALAAKYGITDDAVASWQTISDGLYLNFSAPHGFHEQFDGYFGLQERTIDRNMTKMQYTGPVQHSFRPTQVAQQVDTLLLYHLFPHAFPAEVQRKAYEYYEPRCSHTSTLSRSIYAAVAARTGLLEEAHRQFVLSAETDTGPTAECSSGIHAACLGGNWQAVVLGFGGLSVTEGGLCLDPHLPAHWDELCFTVQWRGTALQVAVRAGEVGLRTAHGAMTVQVGGVCVPVTPDEVVVPLA